MEQPPTIPAVPPLKQAKGTGIVKMIISILVILLLGAWVGFWVHKTVTQIKPVAPAPTPLVNVQPTEANRRESIIATQSAFLGVSQSIASLSASLSTLAVTDTILNPPAIELPLGFDTK